MDVTKEITLEELEKQIEGMKTGGRWTPTKCVPRDRVAIIIPFRDRHKHLVLLLYYLIPMLQRQLLDFRIFVTEQVSIEQRTGELKKN